MEIFGWGMVALGVFMILLPLIPLPGRWRELSRVSWEIAVFGLLLVSTEGRDLLHWPQWLTLPLAFMVLLLAVAVIVRRVREYRRRV